MKSIISLFLAAIFASIFASALVATLTETPAAALAITPTVTFTVKPHVYKASTTLAHQVARYKSDPYDYPIITPSRQPYYYYLSRQSLKSAIQLLQIMAMIA
jgi:hypothetical protein